MYKREKGGWEEEKRRIKGGKKEISASRTLNPTPGPGSNLRWLGLTAGAQGGDPGPSLVRQQQRCWELEGSERSLCHLHCVGDHEYTGRTSCPHSGQNSS